MTDSDSDEKGKDVDQEIDGALARVVELNRRRRIQLDEREEALRRERKAFEEEKKIHGAGNGKCSDVLHLNVGGTRMDVLRRTLTQVDGSMLQSKFSGRWDDSFERDRDGNIFIDQPPDLFETLVDYFRRKNNESAGTSSPSQPLSMKNRFKDDSRWRDFINMLEYYGVTHFVVPITIKRFDDGSMQKPTEITTFYVGKEVTSKSFSAFRFESDMDIASFEVRLESCDSDFDIGWTSRYHPQVNTASNSYPPRVGMYAQSLGLDLKRFEKHKGGLVEFLDRTEFDLSAPLSIRFESDQCRCYISRCYINEKLVFQDEDYNFGGHVIPAVSFAGKCQIVKISFKY